MGWSFSCNLLMIIIPHLKIEIYEQKNNNILNITVVTTISGSSKNNYTGQTHYSSSSNEVNFRILLSRNTKLYLILIFKFLLVV
jgi:hypothetical protein